MFGQRLRFIVTLLVAGVLVAGCSGRQGSALKQPQGARTSPVREISREELASYDGTRGRPAYIAVKGLVYDVTNAREWKNGVHAAWSSERAAGRDLSEFLSKAPPSHRQESFWDDLPLVGRLVD